jgi:hypothetical protein
MFFLYCASPWTLIGDSIILGADHGGNADPFAGPYPGFPGTRYQQAYAGSDFAGPISITGIDFFLEPGFSGSTVSAATYQLSLSIVSTNIDDLSETNLDDNPGPDNTLFTTVALSGTAPDILTFSGGPFYYDPSMGNLLLDIKISNIIGGGSAIFENGDGDGPAGIVRYSDFYDGTIGYGLVTEFTDSAANDPPSPEPRTLILLGCGLAGLFVRRWRRPS